MVSIEPFLDKTGAHSTRSTETGWNIELPQARELHFLGGLTGSFVPFPLTQSDRLQSGYSRLSIAERYTSRDDYLQRVRQCAEKLAAARIVVGTDVGLIVQRATEAWDAVLAANETPRQE